MKVLITSFTFSPQANGVAEVVRAQACGLAERGHDVTVATATDPSRTTKDAFGKLTLSEFSISGFYTGPNHYSGQVEEYQHFIANFPADAIICHCWQTWTTDLAVPVLARSPAAKILVSHGYDAHRWQPQRRFPWGLRQWSRQRKYVRRLPQMFCAFDHIVFLSPTIDRQRFYDHLVLERHGGPGWSAIPNGTRPENFLERRLDFRRQHGLNGKFLILCVGLFAANKDQETALRSFSKACLPDAALVFIGNEINDYARHLQRMAAVLPLGGGSKVLFLEKQVRENIRAAYQAADLVFLTSRGETQPLVLLDAMACGKPFLSTDVGCISELPGGMTASRPRELVAALSLLHNDPERRAALGRQGLTAAQTQYHWETVTGDYDRLLHRLVAGRVQNPSKP